MRPTRDGEDPVDVHQVGLFFGELGILSGWRSMVRARMRQAREVIEVDRSGLQESSSVGGRLYFATRKIIK
jgi:hypothetical protein